MDQSVTDPSQDFFPNLAASRHGVFLDRFSRADPEKMSRCFLRGELCTHPVSYFLQRRLDLARPQLEKRRYGFTVFVVLDAN